MPLETLTAIFGWISVLNLGLLAVASLLVILLRQPVQALHARMFGLEPPEVARAYFAWLAQVKLFTLLFAVAPYLALRIVAG